MEIIDKQNIITQKMVVVKSYLQCESVKTAI